LSEAERRAEKEQLKVRKKAHEQELARLAEQSPRVYEITLKNADKPGLPPPLTTQPAKANAKRSASSLIMLAWKQRRPSQCSFGPGETAKQTDPWSLSGNTDKEQR
jgi:hypothetical protein